MLFSGVILLMLSRMRTCLPTVQYKYLPRDLDTYLREMPYASVTEKRLFDTDDWQQVMQQR